MTTLDRPFEVKSIDDTGVFTGYASVFDEIDSYRDIVKKGAFKKSLSSFVKAKRLVPILWSHDSAQPIGVYSEISEDDTGLAVKGQLNLAVQKGAEAYALLKQGALSGLSIGFNTVRDAVDKASGVRSLLEINLFEASLVTFPALGSARVASVKSVEDLASLSECEDRLRDSGFSKTEAVAFVAAIKAFSRRDSDRAKISQALSLIKGN